MDGVDQHSAPTTSDVEAQPTGDVVTKEDNVPLTNATSSDIVDVGEKLDDSTLGDANCKSTIEMRKSSAEIRQSPTEIRESPRSETSKSSPSEIRRRRRDSWTKSSTSGDDESGDPGSTDRRVSPSSKNDNRDLDNSETDDNEIVAGERESGDGEEVPDPPSNRAEADDDDGEEVEDGNEEEVEVEEMADRKNPAFVPKRGGFFQHDMRIADVAEKPQKSSKKMQLIDSQAKWNHDLFYEVEQAPKSRQELINIYGYDIRNEGRAPAGARIRKYGRIQKQTRDWRDPDSYNPSRKFRGRGGNNVKRENQQANEIQRNSVAGEEDFPPLPANQKHQAPAAPTSANRQRRTQSSEEYDANATRNESDDPADQTSHRWSENRRGTANSRTGGARGGYYGQPNANYNYRWQQGPQQLSNTVRPMEFRRRTAPPAHQQLRGHNANQQQPRGGHNANQQSRGHQDRYSNGYDDEASSAEYDRYRKGNSSYRAKENAAKNENLDTTTQKSYEVPPRFQTKDSQQTGQKVSVRDELDNTHTSSITDQSPNVSFQDGDDEYDETAFQQLQQKPKRYSALRQQQVVVPMQAHEAGAVGLYHPQSIIAAPPQPMMPPYVPRMPLPYGTPYFDGYQQPVAPPIYAGEVGHTQFVPPSETFLVPRVVNPGQNMAAPPPNVPPPPFITPVTATGFHPGTAVYNASDVGQIYSNPNVTYYNTESQQAVPRQAPKMRPKSVIAIVSPSDAATTNTTPPHSTEMSVEKEKSVNE